MSKVCRVNGFLCEIVIMNFAGKLRVSGGLVAFLLAAIVRGALLGEDLPKICSYCRRDDLRACNAFAASLIKQTVYCESTDQSCILGLAIDVTEGFRMSTIDTNLVCLLRVVAAFDETPRSHWKTGELGTVSMDDFDESTTAAARSSLEDLGFRKHQFLESWTFFQSEVGHTTDEVLSLDIKEVGCYSCDSSTDEACQGDVDNQEAIKCDTPSECVTVLLDGHLKRNCSSAFSETILDLCRKPDATSCKLCEIPKCNNMPWNQCYQCGPSDGLNCTLSSSIPTEICPNSDDECSVRITMAGDTVRECSRPGTACSAEEICSSCAEALCNSAVFPANRSRCIQCIDCEEEQDPNTALPCTRYAAKEKCFAYLTDNGKMIRGCLSDPEGVAQCNANATTCVTCDDRAGCNDMPQMKEPSLSCHKCTSKGDVGCAWAQYPLTLARCQNKVPYFVQETCMSNFDPKTQFAIRGCSLDQEPCPRGDINCHTCWGDGCNNRDLKPQYCIQCSSDAPEQENCSELPQRTPSTKCHQQTSFQNRGCFTLVRGNATSRGCIVALKPDDVRFCRREGQFQCEFCSADGCNNHNFKVQECIQCRSDAPGQKSCSELAQGIPSTKCSKKTTFRGSSCFIMTRGNVTRRGCMLDLTPDDVEFCNVGGQSTCKLCPANGCNNHNLRLQKCIQCNSDAPGQASCGDMAKGIPSKKCIRHKMYGNGGCFTLIRGNVTTRGCNDSLTAWTVKFCKEQGRFQCRLCAADGCNNLYAKAQQCIQCSSDTSEQESCGERAEGILSKYCPLYTMPFQRKGCFTTTRGNRTMRGCFGELTPADVNWCKGEGKSKCQLCPSDGCNNQRAVSEAQAVAVKSLFMWILLILPFIS